jgi:shikimate kinase
MPFTAEGQLLFPQGACPLWERGKVVDLPKGGNLFLIGYRGAGKTTVARILAGRLGRSWIDSDAALEERHGRSIARIFAEEGEAGFRDKEAALLEDLCSRRGAVIATGGGVVLRPANCQRLKAAGRVIWLTADAWTLWQRLQNDSTSSERRPILTTGGLAEIEELLRAREPLYRACADITVASAGRSPGEIADAIVDRLAIPTE